MNHYFRSQVRFVVPISAVLSPVISVLSSGLPVSDMETDTRENHRRSSETGISLLCPRLRTAHCLKFWRTLRILPVGSLKGITIPGASKSYIFPPDPPDWGSSSRSGGNELSQFGGLLAQVMHPPPSKILSM